jgi:predicted Fe-Mo cluster-binding NifX family protein
MKVILAETPSLEAPLSMRFARAPYIGWVQPDGSVQFEPNPFLSVTGGAGPQFVAWLANHGVKEVISAAVPGVNASAALEQFGIKHIQKTGIVRDVTGEVKTDVNQTVQLAGGTGPMVDNSSYFNMGYRIGRGLGRWFGGFFGGYGMGFGRGRGRGWGRGMGYGMGYGRGFGRRGGRGFGGRGGFGRGRGRGGWGW